jgi:uncharacterized protein (TIGR03083 family)
LDALAPEEWGRPTVCAGWSVKDVAAHLLGDDVGLLSRWRDGYNTPTFGEGLDVSTWDGLIAAIDRQNDRWVAATRRMSPVVIVALLRWSGEETAAFFRAVDPNALGGPVDWAGPDPAPLWMEVAREYTERWVHQQQLRDAVGAPGLFAPRLFAPVLDAFARALPHALRDHAPADGTTVRLVVAGDAGGTWTVRHTGGDWQLVDDVRSSAGTMVTIDQDLAWRLFTEGVRPDDVRYSVDVEGDPALADAVLHMVTILA